MHIDPSATKYLVKATIKADGIVEKPDVIGAIFGQSEGLLGEELDLRDLQKSGRIGRIEVDIVSKKGKSEGEIFIPSSLDQVETAILGAALETIDRVGPCKADIQIGSIEDTRMKKRSFIVDRARELLGTMIDDNKDLGSGLMDSVRQSIQEEEITSYGEERLPAGPNVETSDSIIVVEGRSDVINLLKFGIKNTVAVEGTSVPTSIEELSRKKTIIAFVDGDRGGELILKELLQVAEVDFIARAPRAHEVEELTQKQIIKALRNKTPSEQFVEMYSLDNGDKKDSKDKRKDKKSPKSSRDDRSRDNRSRDDRSRDNRSRDDRSRDDRSRGDRPKDDKKPAPKKEEKKLSPEQEKIKGALKDLSGSHEAVLLDKDHKELARSPINAMFSKIKENEGKFESIVMDGIITQKLLDTVAPLGVKTVVGIKTGNVTKKPKDVEVWTKDELW